jgi:hypothetical protein
MRAFFLTIVFTTISLAATAQDTAIDTTTNLSYNTDVMALPDSSLVQARSFDPGKLAELRSNKDFDYRQPPSVAESLWDRLLLWLNQLFGWLFRSAVETNWGRVLIYTLGLVLLIVIVMLLLKVDALRVFYTGADKGSLKYPAFQENIHEMDFEKLIREALEKKEYRMGVRLTFLHALKILSDSHQVVWQPGKTNQDYTEEMREGPLKTGFNELSFYFEYAWYGEFVVNESMYRRVKEIFDNWRINTE